MPDSTPVIAIAGFRKVLRRGVVAVDNLDLTVQPGQVMGLAGPNGAGKSITLKAILGLVRPTAGTVSLFGQPVRPGTQVLSRVGALIDGPGFLPYLTGRDNLRLALATSGRPHGRADFEKAVGATGLGAAIDRPYRSYSHGMRYRLGLAQAMFGPPDLMILDEPTTGLDPGHVAEIESMIGKANALGVTVLLSSHVMPLIERLCSHVAIMDAGRLVASGTLADVVGSSRSLEEAYMTATRQPAPAPSS